VPLRSENKIQIRGPGFKTIHQSVYGVIAQLCGMMLSYKAWMSCQAEGLYQAGEALGALECDPKTLKAGRCARHSKFPECSECQQRLDDWLLATQNVATAPELVKVAYAAVLKHQAEWSADRTEALNRRAGCFNTDTATAMYECDDKCGSFWQQLPVDPNGRNAKSKANALFEFSVQANVICGYQGHIRLAITPKYITTGASFGFTNLIMALYRYKLAGKMPKRCKTLIRHTDGGPDNCARITHILHWLLVYLGIFEEVLWFRFEAG
jgi:hypothetical protein